MPAMDHAQSVSARSAPEREAAFEPVLAASRPFSADLAAALEGRGLTDIIARRIARLIDYAPGCGDGDRPLQLPSSASSYLVRAIEQLLPDGLAIADPGHDVPPLTFLLCPHLWRPGTARENLIEAAVLLWAAIDRMDQA